MSEPTPPTAAELAQCQRTLAALCAAGEALPLGDAEVTAVIQQASRLLRKSKKARGAEARRRDEELLDATGIRAMPTEPASAPASTALSRPRTCYICKRQYDRLHAFYDCLCPDCGAFNLEKRHQMADLRGRVAVLTGGRVKIGFQIGLRLLRAGARLIVTTRFPHDAARRYAEQPDAAEWADRLTIFGLDLRHLPAVERFAAALAAREPVLDCFIHNAAQTVRRPPAFYAHLLEGERGPPAALPALARRMVAPPLPLALTTQAEPTRWSWAELSQLPLLPGDQDATAFPVGRLDADQQQVDLRSANSWGAALADVSTIELVEVQAVNCLAAFVLLRGLEPRLRAGPARDRFVVLVSAIEGQFERGFKAGRHPHTNMAKASLNMLTRTCADDYAAERIYLNSVDTGWVSNEAAAPVAERMAREGFRPPLDSEDAAARVLDPVFAGIRSGTPEHGKYFKDYRPAPW